MVKNGDAMTDALFNSQLHSLKRLYSGKVRDIYEVDDRHVLLLASDRLSAFDRVLPTPIPGKGKILTALSSFWFEGAQHIVPNHLTSLLIEDILHDPQERAEAAGRAVVVQRLEPLPIEAIVRGYLVGSGWKDYQRTGAVCGIPLPQGLREGEQLPEPIFTPSTKAPTGAHDENISFEQAADTVGLERMEQVRSISLQLYRVATDHARSRGIIIADTKFEFGLDQDGRLLLMDELFTPDSSRFWPADAYQPGRTPPSFDKQYVRDYLESIGWDKNSTPPELPPEIVSNTVEKYRDALLRLTAEAK